MVFKVQVSFTRMLEKRGQNKPLYSAGFHPIAQNTTVLNATVIGTPAYNLMALSTSCM